jgi:hypothetical protein
MLLHVSHKSIKLISLYHNEGKFDKPGVQRPSAKIDIIKQVKETG